MLEIFLSGTIGKDITLDSVREKVGDSQEVYVKIDSVGGSPNEAFKIYDFLISLNNVITEQVGDVDSAATIIFCAGKDRIANRLGQTYHESRYVQSYDIIKANDSKDMYNNLLHNNNLMAEIYEKNSSLSKEDWLDIMKTESPLSAEQLLEVGIATKIKKQEKVINALVDLKIKNKKNMENGKNNIVTEIKNELNSFLRALKGAKKDVYAEKIEKTGLGQDLVFMNLEPTDTPKVGDKCQLNGETPNGQLIMSNGVIYKLVDGEIKEIINNNTNDSKEQIDFQEKLNAVVGKFNLLEDENKRITKELEAYKNASSGLILEKDKNKGELEEEVLSLDAITPKRFK